MTTTPNIIDWHAYTWGEDDKWMRSDPIVRLSTGRTAIIGRHSYCGADYAGGWTRDEECECWKAVSALFDIDRPRR